MRSFASYLALGCAMALMAASKDDGSSTKAAAGKADAKPDVQDKTGDAKVDPIDKADPAPHPLPADEVSPEPAQEGGGVAGVGLEPGADVNAPTSLDDAEHPKKERVAVIWVQPGHELVAIGALLSIPEDEAHALRAAGRARFASNAEVEAGGESMIELSGL